LAARFWQTPVAARTLRRVLVGRRSERERIDALIAGARHGTSGVLVLRGDAGIGKSALLEYARSRTRGMTEMRASGVESETDLAFAGLTELLGAELAEIRNLPAPQRDALQSALALRAEPANPLAVRVALLTLLATLAERAPVLVTIDDAHWVDESSLRALAFAARRCLAERVAFIVAARLDAPGSLGFDTADEIVLAGLADDEARELLAERTGLNRGTADALVEAAAGNPLALLELPDVIDPGTVADGVTPLPVGPRVNQALHDRLDRLPEPTRLAVGVVAAEGVLGYDRLLAAFRTLGLEEDALLPAERAGMITIVGDRVQLQHPLLRSVAYHSLSGPDRRRVHAALADVFARPTDLERSVWHRAAATVEPDEDVAHALEEVALAAEHRGAVATAAHGFARAASLTPNDDDRARRLLASGDRWDASGQWDASLAHYEEANVYALDPGLQADIAGNRGKLEVYRSGPEKGAQLLVEAADRIERDDPGRATRLLTYAVSAATFAADADQAVALADRAEACGARAGGIHPIEAAFARVNAGLVSGDPRVPEIVAPLEDLAEALMESDLEDAEHVFSVVVFAELVLESWDRAQLFLDMMVRRARETGREFLYAFASTVQAELEWRRGRWTDAYATATNELWDAPTGYPAATAWLLAIQARVAAGLGLDSEAETTGRAAFAAAAESGTHAIEAWSASALGFWELGRQRPQAAIEHLERVASIMDNGKIVEPGVNWWAPDLVEAYWRVGAIGDARRRLESYAAQVEASARVAPRAFAARCAGLLASTGDEAESFFDDALEWHERVDTPFERARTLLCRGERRRAFERTDADESLRDAASAFERIGAKPWVVHTQRMLGVDGTLADTVALTRQERQVAALVGQGATNREAAEQLFLSPRTIDFHLRNIYKKLGVRSRTELAVHMSSVSGA
jgi:DNA-binding CsgD family transcriptional regulator